MMTGCGPPKADTLFVEVNTEPVFFCDVLIIWEYGVLEQSAAFGSHPH